MRFNKFVIGGILILGAVVFLIWSSTRATQEYFLTIDELNAKGSSIVDKNLRVSGAVLGDTIQYDANSLTLSIRCRPRPWLIMSADRNRRRTCSCPSRSSDRSIPLPHESSVCWPQTRSSAQ